MKLMGGSSTRRPPPPALPPPRPVIVVDLKVEMNEACRFGRRSFEIEGQVSRAGSCRVELVRQPGWCCAQPVAKFRAGGRDACPPENSAKIIAGPNSWQPNVGSLGPPCYPLLPR